MENRFARIVLGYHGCLRSTAEDLLFGRLGTDQWRHSQNPWDWLGRGIYFWEHGPERAREWAEASAERKRAKGDANAQPAVIGAIIQLGRCLDLAEVTHTAVLRKTFVSLAANFERRGETMPANEEFIPGDIDLKLRRLDCLVINTCLAVENPANRAGYFQTVRCPFPEGEPAFRGSKIANKTHIQIAVRDPACILGVFRPT